MKPRAKVRLKDKRRIASYATYAASVAVFFVLVGCIAYASRLPSITVSEISVEGAVRSDPHAVTEVVERKLDGTYGLIVPKRLAYVVPNGALTAAVLESFPVIQSAQVHRPSRTKISILIEERVPFALFCSTSCFRMDEYGFIFDTAQPGDSQRKYSGGDGEIGTTYLSGAFHDLARLIEEIEKVSGFHIPAVRIADTDVYATFAEGGEVRFVSTDDHARIVESVSSIFNSKQFDQEKKLEYIELRFANKATVRFKD